MKVIATLQGQLLTNGELPEPVEMTWYNGYNLAEAIVAMGQAALQFNADEKYVRNLSIRLEF